MATGLVYRSGRLTTLSKADRLALTRAGLSDIYDLRTPDVARRAPDPGITGATYHLVNLYALDRPPKANATSVAAAREYMRGLNRGFVTEPAQRKRIALVLREIAQAGQPVLFHCSEGKDRTGWVSALLQYIAGADDQTVLAQYLLSNQERADEIDRSYASVRRASGTLAADIDRAMKTVDASYLNAGLTEVSKRYGGLDAYLSKGLGLEDGTLEALRTKFRVEP
jgi:protein-tyrosine phosphatase